MTHMAAHMAAHGWERVGTIGDVDPYEHDGGVVLRKDGYNHVVEWVDGPCEDDKTGWIKLGLSGPRASEKYTLYCVQVPDDVFKEHDWVKPAEIAMSTGQNIKMLLSHSKSRDFMKRVCVLWDIANHWGWHELDHAPIMITGEKLAERWGDTSVSWADDDVHTSD